ncbi:hypothetical protein ACFL0V_01105 [Nanoarchaeota archaeon]
MVRRLSFNPVKKYKNVAGDDHSQLSWIRGSENDFYETLARFRKASAARAKLAHKVKIELRNTKDKKLIKQKMKLLEASYKKGSLDIYRLLTTQQILQYCALTLLFRQSDALKDLRRKVKKSTMNQEQKRHLKGHIYHQIFHVGKRVEHYWNLSKAKSRGIWKVAEVSALTERGQHRRIRVLTIELDKFLPEAEEQRDRLLHILEQNNLQAYEERESLFVAYFGNLQDVAHKLEHILHRSKILEKTVEKEFRGYEAEVKKIGWKPLEKHVSSVKKKLQRTFEDVEAQHRRAKIDLLGMAEKVKPVKTKKAA